MVVVTREAFKCGEPVWNNMSKKDSIYIGRKPPMTYVLAVLTAFNEMGADSIDLKARGRAISTAVDVAEICRNRFMKDIRPVGIGIDTEQLPSHDGGTRGVSSITITMKKVGTASVDHEEVGSPSKEDEGAASPIHAGLSRIKGVGGAREEKLIGAGFTTVESIAASNPEELAERSGISTKIAAGLIESAKNLRE